MFPGAGEKQTQEQQRNPTVEQSFNTYEFWSHQRNSLSSPHSKATITFWWMTTPLRAGADQPLKLLKGQLLSIVRSLLSLKRWQRKAIFLWLLVRARVPSRRCCDDLIFHCPEEELNSSSRQILYSYDIPSVKCHLFYKYSTEVTHKFSFSPPSPNSL